MFRELDVHIGYLEAQIDERPPIQPLPDRDSEQSGGPRSWKKASLSRVCRSTANSPAVAVVGSNDLEDPWDLLGLVDDRWGPSVKQLGRQKETPHVAELGVRYGIGRPETP